MLIKCTGEQRERLLKILTETEQCFMQELDPAECSRFCSCRDCIRYKIDWIVTDDDEEDEDDRKGEGAV